MASPPPGQPLAAPGHALPCRGSRQAGWGRASRTISLPGTGSQGKKGLTGSFGDATRAPRETVPSGRHFQPRSPHDGSASPPRRAAAGLPHAHTAGHVHTHHALLGRHTRRQGWPRWQGRAGSHAADPAPPPRRGTYLLTPAAPQPRAAPPWARATAGRAPAARRPSLPEELWPQPRRCLHAPGTGSSAPPSAKACELPAACEPPPSACQPPMARGSPAPRGDTEGPCPRALASLCSPERWGRPAPSISRRRRAGGWPRQSSRGFLAFWTGLPVLPAALTHQRRAHLYRSCHGNSLRAGAREG